MIDQNISPTTGRQLDAIEVPDGYVGTAVTLEYKPIMVQISNAGGGVNENSKGEPATAPINAQYADVMYESLEHLSIDNILCVVLTGMGADGSKGIASLRTKKKLYVITQSEDTCVVYGMPKATDQMGLSNQSAPITGIANAIVKEIGG